MRINYANAMATIAVVVAASGGSWAFAQAGDDDDEIVACVNKRNGNVRILAAGKRCNKLERRLTWNREGQQGVPGADGVDGKPGPGGPAGPAGPAGEKGEKGDKGDKGDTGQRGEPGTGGGGGGAVASTRWYRDEDGDNYGDWYEHMDSAVKPDGYVGNNRDCNDRNPNVNPVYRLDGANREDDDCDGVADENRARLWYRDQDGDGWGGTLLAGGETGTPPEGYVDRGHDCDDGSAKIYPGKFDCVMTGGSDAQDWDGDGHKAQWFGGDDCDDVEVDVNPAETEVLYSGLDNDCDPGTPDVAKRDDRVFVPAYPAHRHGAMPSGRYLPTP